MTTLIAIYTGDGCIGRCDAKCYNAWGPECHCICQGGNHGAGKQEATTSTQELPASLVRPGRSGRADHLSPPAARDGRHELSGRRP